MSDIELKFHLSQDLYCLSYDLKKTNIYSIEVLKSARRLYVSTDNFLFLIRHQPEFKRDGILLLGYGRTYTGTLYGTQLFVDEYIDKNISNIGTDIDSTIYYNT